MKKENFLILFVILILSIILAVFLPKTFFSQGSLNQVEQVPIIKSAFPLPSKKYFNKNSIDLSPYVKISNNQNKQPFYLPTNTQNGN